MQAARRARKEREPRHKFRQKKHFHSGQALLEARRAALSLPRAKPRVSRRDVSVA